MRLSGSDLACFRGGRQVFAGLSFTVEAGEALVVLGPNGAGKSSLLRLVAGLTARSAGTLSLAGSNDELTIAEQAHYLGHLTRSSRRSRLPRILPSGRASWAAAKTVRPPSKQSGSPA